MVRATQVVNGNQNDFFARYLDQQIQALVSASFELVYFKRVLLEDERTGHFQSMILRHR